MNPVATNPAAAPSLPAAAPAVSDSAAVGQKAEWEWALSPEVYPNIDDLIIEDDEPVENRFIEQQLLLLRESLSSSWAGPGEGRSFKVFSNVALYYMSGRPPLVPDVMLSLDIPINVDLSLKDNRSYFSWIVGKLPELVIEIVSDLRGGEDSLKMRDYARLGIDYYVVFDPNNRLGQGVLRVFGRSLGTYQPVDPGWLPSIGLGLTVWQGAYEGQEARWLRWCDQQGQVIATGHELAVQERQRAERLRAQLRALGVEPVD
jgi:Uma2 family endonuclease